MRLLLELMLVHVAYATSQPSLARVAAVRLCTPALRVALQPRSGSVPVSGNLTEEPSPCHEIVLYKSNTFCYTSIMKSEIAGTLVEWDENKNQLNIRKHGISFQTAALVFADEERIEYLDKLHSQDEERYVVLGCVQGVLYVVYTMRNDYARIISARVATSYERKIYYGEE